jgi:hypothetical protein
MFVDFDEDRTLFRTFSNSFDASQADAKSTLHFKIIELH